MNGLRHAGISSGELKIDNRSLRVGAHTKHTPFYNRPARQRLNTSTLRAQGEKQNLQKSAEEDDDLEALEKSSRSRRRSSRSQPRSPTSLQQSDSQGWAEWKEGSLFPEGWEEMNSFQKAGELWSGKRGALFWANKVSWAALFVVGGAWVLFRFVGPVTGLYNLKNDLLSPPSL